MFANCVILGGFAERFHLTRKGLRGDKYPIEFDNNECVLKGLKKCSGTIREVMTKGWLLNKTKRIGESILIII